MQPRGWATFIFPRKRSLTGVSRPLRAFTSFAVAALNKFFIAFPSTPDTLPPFPRQPL